VYDSTQSWGGRDRGIQLFGSARELSGSRAADATRTYGNRFTAFARADTSAYRCYRFRPSRLKLFDERSLGSGVFVTARMGRDRRPRWERTEVYRAGS